MAGANPAPCDQVSNPKSARAKAGLAAILFAAALFLAPLRTQAQTATGTTPASGQITGQVIDQSGAVIPGAVIRDAATGTSLGQTDGSGKLTLNCAAPCTVRIDAAGFKSAKTEWQDAKAITLDVSELVPGPNVTAEPEMPVARPALSTSIDPVQGPSTPPAPANVIPPTQHTVTVTAYRTPLGELESPVSTRTLSQTDLQQAAAITLDGQLRLIPGAETFRRSSSLVANPSSQGISLRGLGSTSASRTLVTQDDVPSQRRLRRHNPLGRAARALHPLRRSSTRRGE